MSMLKTLRSVVRFRSFETDPDLRRLRRAANVDDLRAIAKRRLPGGVFDYVDGAAEDEITYRRNETDLHHWEFVPAVLRDVASVDCSTTLLGRHLSMPLVLAPTGFTRIVEPQGELAVARAGESKGVPYCLSTLGTRSIEEVAAVSGGRKWFQVYVWKDRGLVKNMVSRAEESGFEVLVITADLAVPGRRERDVRRGFTLPPKLGPGLIAEGMIRPSWTWRFLRSDPISFANVVGLPGYDGSTAVELADLVTEQFDASLSWSDIEWFRSIWPGPIVIKGIQSVADARRAVDHGVDAIAVSNHGGRQLDYAPTPIGLVGPVVEAVGDSVEVICDGGIRRGADILKAVALGARAVMAGRAYLYGLGAAGEKGVDWVLDFLREGLTRTMALAGVRSMAEVDRGLVRRRN